MFKPELWQSHDEYRTIVNSLGRRLSATIPVISLMLTVRSAKNYFLLTSTLSKTISLPFIPQKAVPLYIRRRSCAPSSSLPCFFNRTDAKTSLTAWVRDVLPNSISLACLCGFPSLEGLPPLGSYYDLMNRLWLNPREQYSRSALLPVGKNGKKTSKDNWQRRKTCGRKPRHFFCPPYC